MSSCQTARTPPVNGHLQVLQGISGETSSGYFQELGVESAVVQPRSLGSSNCTAPSIPPWLGTWLRNTQPPSFSQYVSVSPGSLMELPMRQSVCALWRCASALFLSFTMQPFKVDKKLANVVGLQMLARPSCGLLVD